MNLPKQFEIILTEMTSGGAAAGRMADGRMVFVPFGLPGERVLVEISLEKRSSVQARLIRVLQPAPQRIAARCIHFQACGGCQYQHLAYPDQLRLKENQVGENLLRIAEIKAPPLGAIRPAAAEWNYRSSFNLFLTPEGKPGLAGLEDGQLLPISECHLPAANLNDLWPRLDFEPDTGLEQVELRQGSGDELLLVLSGEEPNPPEFAVDLPLSVVYDSPVGEMVLSGEKDVLVEVLGRPFKISANSSFPANLVQTGAMLAYGLELAGSQPLGTVLEVGCGVGLFSAFLAEKAARLVAIEADPDAGADFAANLDEFENVELYQGSPELILASLKLKPDFAVLHSSGEGLSKAALEAMAGMRPARILYVSDDPAILSRDARRLLKAGYLLCQVTPFDLYPQTFRIDCMAMFKLPDRQTT